MANEGELVYGPPNWCWSKEGIHGPALIGQLVSRQWDAMYVLLSWDCIFIGVQLNSLFPYGMQGWLAILSFSICKIIGNPIICVETWF